MDRRPDDRAVTVISLWLARHVDDRELLAQLETIGFDSLEPGQVEAVQELLGTLRGPSDRGKLEMVARETLESLALGG